MGNCHQLMATRRQFISVGAAMMATSLLPRAVAPGRAGWARVRSVQAGNVTIWAVARVGDGYAGLVRTADGPAELRWLAVDADGGLRPGDRLGPTLPADLTPVAVAATPAGLFVGGTRAVVMEEVPTLPPRDEPDHLDEAGVRAALRGNDLGDEVMVPTHGTTATLHRVAGETLEPVPLPSELGGSFSTVEALAPLDDGRLHALVAHSGADEEAWYAANLAALTVEDGAVGDVSTVASDLGESGPNHLLGTPGGTAEVVVNRTADVVVEGSELTYTRLAVERWPIEVRSAAPPRRGRALAVFPRGAVVQDPETAALTWDSPHEHPPPAVLGELAAAPDAGPTLLAVAGDPDRGAALVGDRLTLVDM